MRCEFNIAVVAGDGIGPEITDAAIRVLRKIGRKIRLQVYATGVIAGGCAIDKYGEPLPGKSSVDACLAADSVLLGAVGGPKWDTLPGHLRPERALLGVREAMGLYANIRPARLFPELASACPLKSACEGTGFDLVIVRELTGGIYYGERGRREGKFGIEAYDTECYGTGEIERIGRVAFEMARGRRRKLTSIDKANVLRSSRLWREVMHRLAAEYPDIEYSDMLVDNAAMQLIRDQASLTSL